MSALNLIDELLGEVETAHELYPTEFCRKRIQLLRELRKQHARYIEQVERIQQYLPIFPKDVQEGLRRTQPDSSTWPVRDERVKPLNITA